MTNTTIESITDPEIRFMIQSTIDEHLKFIQEHSMFKLKYLIFGNPAQSAMNARKAYLKCWGINYD